MALEILRRVQRGAFAAPTLHASLAEVSDRRDRSFITDLTYGVLRWQIWLDAALAPLLRAPERLPERVRLALQIASYELLIRESARFAVTNEWVGIIRKGSPQLSGLVNAVLRRVGPPESTDEATALSLPGWLYSELQQSLGGAAADAARGMLQPEPLWLAALAPQAEEILLAEGSEVTPGPVSGSLAVRLEWPLNELESFTAGLVQPMNPASLLVARLLGADEGDRVYDLASGNGIKGAVLAATGARVTSIEVDEQKVWRAKQNQRRLQVRTEHIVSDLRELPAGLVPAPFVLLDAPCTGTGTLRGNPEIKLRLEQRHIAEAAALQRELLNSAAPLTAPGGVLLYAVCSLSQAEGPAVVADFLALHPEFSSEPLAAHPELPLHEAGAGSYVLPLDGLDGFFIARLRRQA